MAMTGFTLGHGGSNKPSTGHTNTGEGDKNYRESLMAEQKALDFIRASATPAPKPSTSSSGGTGGGSGGGGYAAPAAPAFDAFAAARDLYNQQQSAAEALYQRQQEQAQAAYALRDTQRQQAHDASVAARQNAYNDSVGKLDTQVNQGLQENWVAKMMAERNFGQQMSAMGRSGGGAESSLLALENQYGQGRGSLERGRTDAMADYRLLLDQGLAQDAQALANARADDAIAQFETQNSIEMQMQQARAQAAQQQAELLFKQQAEMAARQQSAYNATARNQEQATAKTAEASAKRVQDAVSGAAQAAYKADGTYDVDVFRNYLSGRYRAGFLSEDEAAAALAQAAGVFR